ncbi:MAG: glutathione peroxidase [Gammaproteobacteria bacterium]|nr:MAG: glutathione peroxidase [Gammaproteobacteria bacterium]
MKILYRLIGCLGMGFITSTTYAACAPHLEGDYRKLHSSESINLCKLVENKVTLVLNTASHCGFAPQFKGLEALNKKYKDKGLVVVGFASDDFNQEDKDEGNAAGICFVNFGVTFTMFAPTHVRGDEVNNLFKYLGSESEAPQWNFNKYLLDKNGKVIQHFGSMTGPDSKDLKKAIEKALAI